jgi:hypothetical protein
MHAQHCKALAAACVVALLAACGGDDDPTPTQTAIGTIDGFGSVVVNGVRFDDARASITMDDAVQTRDRLRVGMVVQVRGRIHNNGTGVADSIRYEDCVQGPITAMNQVQNTVTVLGQTVLVDDDTVFDGVMLRDMNSFSIGDQVEVSCLRDPANNRLRATRMERQGTFQNGVSELEVKGTVNNLDLTARTCTIGGLTVNFANLGAGAQPAGLANGMTVEAGGRGYANGVLTADRLRDRDRDRIHFPDGDGLEITGYIADFVSISNFTVAGQAVNAQNAAFRNGTAADLRNGLKVEVEGTVTNNVLVASVVVVKLQANVHVESGLQAKDAARGTLTLLGRPFKVTAETVLRDRLTRADQPALITLDALASADRLEVNAYEDAAGDLVATRVERTAADVLVVVKGPADAKQPTTQLTLAGFDVSTGDGSVYRDASGAAVDAATFYGAVAVPPAVPTVVRARGVVGSLATNVVDATRSTSTIGELRIGDH